MVCKKMYELGSQRSMIREIFDYAKERELVVGSENICDFSIGNPYTDVPCKINEAIVEIINNYSSIDAHGYTKSSGLQSTRDAIAVNLNKRFNTNYTGENFYLTPGAASSLNISFKAIIESKDDEIIVLIPYFPEYKVFIESQGGKMVLVEPNEDLSLNIENIKNAITKNTRAIIINSPNNPSGIIYTRDEIEKISEILREKSKEYNRDIYIVSDEPYRELVYTDEEVTFIPNIYDKTIVCYSWSKSFSLAGERIGYVLVPNECNFDKLIYAVNGAGRALGYICAPSLFQRVIEKCVDVKPNIEIYRENREILYRELTNMGYSLAKPSGAFYMFIKSPSGDGFEFYERAKKEDLLLVPGKSFGRSDYVRLSYCVDPMKVKNSIAKFKKVMDEYISLNKN